MKKTLFILLALLLLLSLCACGETAAPSAAPAAESGETSEQAAQSTPEPSPEPTPEPVYVTREKNLLSKKTVDAQNLPTLNNYAVLGPVLDTVTYYSYDEFGTLLEEKNVMELPNMPEVFDYQGKEREGYSYTYTDSGELESVSYSNSTFNDYPITETVRYEAGRPVESLVEFGFVDDRDLIEQSVYSYDASGRLTGIETTTYGDVYYGMYRVPDVMRYAFDEKGYCSSLKYEGYDGKFDVAYSYDADGNLIRLEALEDGQPYDLQEISLENGVQTSLTRTRNGSTVEYRFIYDDEGRPERTEWTFEEKQHALQYSYNEDGYLSEADWVDEGQVVDKATYTYTTDDDGDVSVQVQAPNGPNPFGGRTSGTVFYQGYSFYDGQPRAEYAYELKNVLTSIYYIRSHTEYDYDRHDVLVEVDPSSSREASSLGDFYPDLQDSYGGHPLPVPDGSRRLRKVTLHTGDELTVVAEPQYDADGKLTGYTCSFDGIASASYMGGYSTETDEQGRLTKIDFNYYTLDYIYADDGLSYKMIRNYADGKVSEKEVQLSERLIPELVKKSPDELSYGVFTYGEDGLPTEAVFTWTNAEGEEVSETETYSYLYDLAEDGTIKALKQHPNEGSYDRNILSFDEQGYLYAYQMNYRNNYYFSYEYADIT